MSQRNAERRTALALVVLVLVAALGVAGCSREPLEVSQIQIGKSLNSDKSVSAHTTRFSPDDTIYASVITQKSGSSVLGVRWLYAGKMISEMKREVSYKGQAATEFHLQYAGKLPVGEYKVEILVDDKPAGERDFRVEP